MTSSTNARSRRFDVSGSPGKRVSDLRSHLMRTRPCGDGTLDKLARRVHRRIEEIVAADRKRRRLRLHVPIVNNGRKMLTDGLLGETEVAQDEADDDAAAMGLSEKFLSGPIGGAILNSNASASSVGPFDVWGAHLHTPSDSTAGKSAAHYCLDNDASTGARDGSIVIRVTSRWRSC